MTKIGGEGSGPVEMDETFVGGKVKNMHKSKIKEKFHGKGTQGGHGKAVVMGMLERGGQVRAKVVEGRLKHQLAPVINAHVETGSHIITDEFVTYTKLETTTTMKSSTTLKATFGSISIPTASRTFGRC